MYQTCPKCGYQRRPSDVAPDGECPACGLIFAKWLRQRYRQSPRQGHEAKRKSSAGRKLRSLLLCTEPAWSPAGFYGRLLLFLALAVWGGQFILMDHRTLVAGLPEINYSFLHGVNLVFHEAGHVLFRPFGDFLATLGGSLSQLLIPLLASAAFLLHQDPFAAAVGVWWCGQSLMDLAPYIHDASTQQLVLLGGVSGKDFPGYHDWNNLLSRLGILDWAPGLASLANGSGAVAMLGALGWGGYILYRQYQIR